MPGASPETMAATVATPLERHLGIIADVAAMSSENLPLADYLRHVVTLQIHQTFSAKGTNGLPLDRRSET
jgi:multidrug efflux pump subunit AcrB